MLHHIVCYRFTDISEVLAASTSETLVNFYQTTWCNITEDSHPHTCCCENLKYHQKMHVAVLFRKEIEYVESRMFWSIFGVKER
jgi:hypothetical protein